MTIRDDNGMLSGGSGPAPSMNCQWCGMIHSALCPRVKAIEYEGGMIKRIEFHDGQAPAPLQAQQRAYGYGYVWSDATGWVLAS